MEEQDTAHDAEPVFDERGVAEGTDVGGYVIDGELGRGGMGVVYSATHPMIGKRAAIKVLKPSLSNNPATVERFLQEARSVNQIGHPNIVDIFAFGSLRDGRRYLVMDLLQGESLRTRVKRGPLHVREAAACLDEIASALMAAHDKGFVHRDLKPDNVFLCENPGRIDVKLLDFGLAKLLPNAVNTRAYRTATGAQLGTPDYMSPEQLRGEKEVDARTDVYALGVVAFEVLTGKRPRRFSDGSFNMDGKTPADVLTFVPAELAQLVEALLARDPAQRPSLAAVRTVIKRVLAGNPVMPHDPAVSRLVSDADAAFSGLPDAPPETTPDATPEAAARPSSPALRTSGVHPSTTLGVPPPPPRVSRSASVAPPVATSRESRPWLILAVLLLISAGIALVIVLAT